MEETLYKRGHTTLGIWGKIKITAHWLREPNLIEKNPLPAIRLSWRGWMKQRVFAHIADCILRDWFTQTGRTVDNDDRIGIIEFRNLAGEVNRETITGNTLKKYLYPATQFFVDNIDPPEEPSCALFRPITVPFRLKASSDSNKYLTDTCDVDIYHLYANTFLSLPSVQELITTEGPNDEDGLTQVMISAMPLAKQFFGKTARQ